MKRLWLVGLVFLMGCGAIPTVSGVSKQYISRVEFPADSTICYTYFQSAISCVRNPEAFRSPR